jgi:hypothetical protein
MRCAWNGLCDMGLWKGKRGVLDEEKALNERKRKIL